MSAAERPRPSVFLSYASEDREAARIIRNALPNFGLEPWYDESELGGGEAWDQKIRRQIRECDYFMPVVSARTEARLEGYFRREWRLAVERTLDMADDHTFLLPIVIDDTNQGLARVPEKFLTVQWLRVPGGQATPAFEALCRRIANGSPVGPRSDRIPASRGGAGPSPLAGTPAGVAASGVEAGAVAGTGAAPGGAGGAGAAGAAVNPPSRYPAFPLEEPGQRARFWIQVAGWVLGTARVAFAGLPKWVRIIVYVWLLVGLISRCDSTADHKDKSELSPATAKKLKVIADKYDGSSDPADIPKLARDIAREFAGGASAEPHHGPLLAVPFTAPAGDTSAAKLADSVFALVYGRVAIAHPGEVNLSRETSGPPVSPGPPEPVTTGERGRGNTPLPPSALAALPALPADPATAVELGKASHATYVLSGAVEKRPPAQVLTVRITSVADDTVVWSKSYPVASANAAAIADEVNSHLPSLDDES